MSGLDEKKRLRFEVVSASDFEGLWVRWALRVLWVCAADVVSTI